MSTLDIKKLTDQQKIKLVKNRWDSSQTLWEVVRRTYDQNTRIYENKSAWLDNISVVRRKNVVQANRVFVNMESVINSLIANPPGINVLPARKGEDA